MTHPKTSDRAEAAFRAALRRHAARLAELLADEPPVPKLIVAHQVLLVLRAAIGYASEPLAEAARDWLVGQVRREFAVCQYCDAAVPTNLTHHPICERCDARLETEFCDVADDPGSPP